MKNPIVPAVTIHKMKGPFGLTVVVAIAPTAILWIRLFLVSFQQNGRERMKGLIVPMVVSILETKFLIILMAVVAIAPAVVLNSYNLSDRSLPLCIIIYMTIM
jgi:hypothetical protein